MRCEEKQCEEGKGEFRCWQVKSIESIEEDITGSRHQLADMKFNGVYSG